ncbi:filamentous haemagglutinin family protein [Variovorax boronicumulans]|uniref:filamentous haemagglutinin family protein n=1 Tax=Variovorax boronicumulans TaxID=436515 RepID=UPI00214CAA66
MTTFGGDILGWSAEGDINAGRGSKTTLVYTPPKREYDTLGNVKLSPNVPSTGAGIATLDPIPEVPPGDVDLIAPLGTIDAGEAGIRVSGNVNLSALQVVNAANIQVKGESAGLPLVASVNVGALTNASAAASQASAAAQEVLQRERVAAR